MMPIPAERQPKTLSEKSARSRPQSTRARLLEVATDVFAEKGFASSSSKEICERAGANSAAVNYYFGGIAKLYELVLSDAGEKLGGLSFAEADGATPEQKLRNYLNGVLHATADQATTSSALRIVAREIAAPTRNLPDLMKWYPRETSALITLVSDFMGLPRDNPAVARGCISVIAPCCMLLFVNRELLENMSPHLKWTKQGKDGLVDQTIDHLLAGLKAVADAVRDTRKLGVASQ